MAKSEIVIINYIEFGRKVSKKIRELTIPNDITFRYFEKNIIFAAIS